LRTPEDRDRRAILGFPWVYPAVNLFGVISSEFGDNRIEHSVTNKIKSYFHPNPSPPPFTKGRSNHPPLEKGDQEGFSSLEGDETVSKDYGETYPFCSFSSRAFSFNLNSTNTFSCSIRMETKIVSKGQGLEA
jgi:hypothetical protein